MKRPIAALAAIGIALGLTVAAVPIAASAHTGDLNAAAVCQTDGTYKVTYSLTISKTDETGVTNWKVGTSTFEGTPTSDAGLAGAIASTGSGTIVLGTTTVPGTSTSAPWAYAFTTWSPDGYTKGSDGGNIELAGTCAPPDFATASYKLNVAAGTCDAVGSASVTELNHATLDAPLDTTPGTHTVSLTADKGFTFADGTKMSSQDYTVPAQTTGLVCYPPVQCVSLPGWSTEDIAPVQVIDGLRFAGPHSAAVDTYQRVSSGNLQGVTGIGYTDKWGPNYDSAAAQSFTAQVVIEVNPNTDLSATPGVNHYATVSAIVNTVGTFTNLELQPVWYTSKIAYADAGGQDNPITLAALEALMPANTLLSAPSLHLQTSSTGTSDTIVSEIHSTCGAADFVSVKPDPQTRQTVITTDEVCTLGTEGGLTPGGGSTTTTTTNYETDYSFDSESGTYALGEEYVVGDPIVVTNSIDVNENCPMHVLPVDPILTTVPCGQDQTVVLPADTEQIAYSVTNSTKTGATVEARATSTSVVVDAPAGWTIDDSGVANKTVVYATLVACVTTQLTNVLAHTGADTILGIPVLSLAGIALAMIVFSTLMIVIAYRRRHTAE